MRDGRAAPVNIGMRQKRLDRPRRDGAMRKFVVDVVDIRHEGAVSASLRGRPPIAQAARALLIPRMVDDDPVGAVRRIFQVGGYVQLQPVGLNDAVVRHSDKVPVPVVAHLKTGGVGSVGRLRRFSLRSLNRQQTLPRLLIQRLRARLNIPKPRRQPKPVMFIHRNVRVQKIGDVILKRPQPPIRKRLLRGRRRREERVGHSAV